MFSTSLGVSESVLSVSNPFVFQTSTRSESLSSLIGWKANSPFCSKRSKVSIDGKPVSICAVALDAEMVTLVGGTRALARISVVNCRHEVLLDRHVCIPRDHVENYGTAISGVEEHHLRPENGALPFSTVQV